MKDFVVIKGFVDKDRCCTMANKLDNLYKENLSLPPDNQCIISPAFYGIFNDEALEFLPAIEKITGKKLFPTYTYARIYQRNEVLLPHTDREECEFSFTLTLKYDTDVWPFFIQTKDATTEEILCEGDILVYKGIENLHWRMPLKTNFQYQAFFHYVDQQGNYANKRYDGRAEFATSNQSIEELKRKKHVL